MQYTLAVYMRNLLNDLISKTELTDQDLTALIGTKYRAFTKYVAVKKLKLMLNVTTVIPRWEVRKFNPTRSLEFLNCGSAQIVQDLFQLWSKQ